jgi:hypothetical protein
MRKATLIVFVIFFAFPSFVSASVARPLKEVLEAVITKCRPCKKLLTSPVTERLIKKGLIKNDDADEIAKFLSRFGDDGLKYLDNFGDDALVVFKKYGDDGMSYLKRHGDDYLELIKRESPETVHKILRHPDGMIFLKESPDLVKHYAKYGDDLLECLGKNPLCVESVKRTGLSPKIISGLKDTNVSWLEVRMPELSPKDANAFQDMLKKYGDPAAEFVRKNWDVFAKTGALVMVAANFDQVLAGGRDVLMKAVETTGEVAKEGVKTAVKETTATLGSRYLFLLILCVAGICLAFLAFRKKRR